MAWRVERRVADEVRVTSWGHLRETHVIWDVTLMRDYESGARRAWQEKLVPRRRYIRSITVVGGSALVRMGASTIGLLLGVPCKFVSAAGEVTPG